MTVTSKLPDGSSIQNVAILDPTTGLPASFGGVTEVFAGTAGGVGDIGGTVTFTAAAQTSTPVSTRGFASMQVICISATNTGTNVTWEGSNDNWATFFPIIAPRRDTTAGLSTASSLGPSSGNEWDVPLKFAQVRLRCTAYTTNPTTFQYVLKTSSATRMIVEQGNTNALWATSSTAKTTTTGGLGVPYVLIGAATTNGVSIKVTAGQIYSIDMSNNHATAWMFFKVYAKASAAAPATDTAVAVFGCAPNSSRSINFGDIGYAVATGIAAALTLLPALNDNTALASIYGSVTVHYV
jgi:hypothetical protein